MIEQVLVNLKNAITVVENEAYRANLSGEVSAQSLAATLDDAFNEEQRDAFCRLAQRKPAIVSQFIENYLLTPRAVVVTELLGLNAVEFLPLVINDKVTQGKESSFDAFRQRFHSAYLKANDIRSISDIDAAASKARAYLTRNNTLQAMQGFRTIFGAESWMSHSSKSDTGVLFTSLLPDAFISAAAEPYLQAIDLSADWGNRLFREHNACDSSQQEKLKLADDKWITITHSTYSILEDLLARSKNEDWRDCSLFRAHALYSSFNSFLTTESKQQPISSFFNFWKTEHKEHHENYAGRFKAAYSLIRPPYRLHCTFPVPKENILASYPPIETQFGNLDVAIKPYLSEKWVIRLKNDLQTSTIPFSTNSSGLAAHTDQALHNRTVCLHGEPGTGKTEALKLVMAHFMTESQRIDAKELGWHAPIIGRYATGSSFFATHYSETLINIKRFLDKIQSDADKIKAVPFVIIEEIDCLLAGGDVKYQAEENKNMHELSRYLDNSISHNSLFVLCTTNDISSLSPQAHSRLIGKAHRYTTPPALRMSVAGKIVESLGLSYPYEVQRTTEGDTTGSVSIWDAEHSIIKALVTTLFNDVSFRQYCLIPEKLYNCVQNTPEKSKFGNLYQIHQTQYHYADGLFYDSNYMRHRGFEHDGQHHSIFYIQGENLDAYQSESAQKGNFGHLHLGTEQIPGSNFSLFASSDALHILHTGSPARANQNFAFMYLSFESNEFETIAPAQWSKFLNTNPKYCSMKSTHNNEDKREENISLIQINYADLISTHADASSPQTWHAWYFTQATPAVKKPPSSLMNIMKNYGKVG